MGYLFDYYIQIDNISDLEYIDIIKKLERFKHFIIYSDSIFGTCSK